MNAGFRIRELRRTLKLNQTQLAAKASITQGSLSEIERGNTKCMKSDTILALAKALGTTPEWLQTGKGPSGKPLPPEPGEADAVQIFRAMAKDSRATWLSYGRWLLDR